MASATYSPAPGGIRNPANSWMLGTPAPGGIRNPVNSSFLQRPPVLAGRIAGQALIVPRPPVPATQQVRQSAKTVARSSGVTGRVQGGRLVDPDAEAAMRTGDWEARQSLADLGLERAHLRSDYDLLRTFMDRRHARDRRRLGESYAGRNLSTSGVFHKAADEMAGIQQQEENEATHAWQKQASLLNRREDRTRSGLEQLVREVTLSGASSSSARLLAMLGMG